MTQKWPTEADASLSKYEQDAVAETGDTTPEFLIWSFCRSTTSEENDEVTISRKFGDENIRVIFSTVDIQAEEDFEEEPEAESDVEDPAPYPVRAVLSIAKSNSPGALNIDLMCQKGHFVIENISLTLWMLLYKMNLKRSSSREVSMLPYSFIPEYAARKEQQKYVKWLGKVKNFIDL
ncbi:hypothetical protein BYT27DRAFT_7207950 [Phlegmacium glaucopus]|nr:hypothetical protein BYT27DRAFT_7207950 [Phlegmacium glaucopus]